MEQRLTRLEEKVCFGEDLLETLNRTVFEQQRQIDLLAAEVRALRQQVQMSFPAEAGSLRDEIPPHY